MGHGLSAARWVGHGDKKVENPCLRHCLSAQMVILYFIPNSKLQNERDLVERELESSCQSGIAIILAGTRYPSDKKVEIVFDVVFGKKIKQKVDMIEHMNLYLRNS